MTGLVGFATGARLLGIGRTVKEKVFSPTGLKIILVVVLAVAGYFLFQQGKAAYKAYVERSATEIVLTRENARLKQTQQEQAKQYQADLQTQRVVFQKITEDQNRQITTLASRVNRVQKLDRDFAQAQKDIANVRPEDDADAAPVLDNAVDFLQSYAETNAGPR